MRKKYKIVLKGPDGKEIIITKEARNKKEHKKIIKFVYDELDKMRETARVGENAPVSFSISHIKSHRPSEE